jgi:hypothetical protein
VVVWTVAVGTVLEVNVVWFAGTVKLAVGNALFDPVRVTAAPPLGAGPVRFTVTLTLLPPVTDVGETLTDCTAGGFTVNEFEVADEPAYDAVTVTGVAAETGLVGSMVEVNVVWFAGTVRLPVGNAPFDPVSVTSAPPLGAGPVRFTVTLTLVPPVTDVGETLTDCTAGGFTVNEFEVADEPAYEAVTVTGVAEETGLVGSVFEVNDVWLAGTVRLPVGNAAFDPVSVTSAPPLGAAAVRVTVTLTLLPPVTDAGDTDTDCTATDGGLPPLTKNAACATICRYPMLFNPLHVGLMAAAVGCT